MYELEKSVRMLIFVPTKRNERVKIMRTCSILAYDAKERNILAW
jgi:hypothetical protein